MKTRSVFLRNGCLLPDGLTLEQRQFNAAWMSAEDLSAAGLDAAVRHAGWHFMWIEDACSRLGCGRTEESAADRAVTRALRQVSAEFNVAEADSVKFAKFPGFRIAKATVHPRQIQQDYTLGAIDQVTIQQLSVR